MNARRLHDTHMDNSQKHNVRWKKEVKEEYIGYELIHK